MTTPRPRPKRRRRVIAARSISLVETILILVIFAVLVGGLAPVVSGIIRKQKLGRAESDVVAIRDCLLAFASDTPGEGPAQDGGQPLGGQKPVELAVGDGDVPELGPNGSADWLRPVNFSTVDFLANHLVQNQPGRDPAKGYPTWKGAYVTPPIRPDPWGNRYMVNAIYLWGPAGYRYDTVVLSAGPDEEVDSAFTLDGFVPGDDDVVAIVSSGKGPNSLPP